MTHRVRAWAALRGRSAATSAQNRIDDVARAIIGGEPGDAQEMEDARSAAIDVLEALGAGGRDAGAPSIDLHVVASTLRPGELSLRAEPTDRSWSPVFERMDAAGFKPGDVVRITVVSR